MENFALDFCYRLRPQEPPPKEILIVGIDAPSFRELKEPWPWPRRWHAQLIRRLHQLGAAVIVFDVFFGEPSTSEDDQLLATAIRESGQVILARLLDVTRDPFFFRQILRQPLPEFCVGACALAVILHTPDPDKVVRRFHLAPAGQETLPQVVVRQFRPNLTLTPGLTGLIHYAGPSGHLETVSYHRVIDDKHPLPPEQVRGRIVLVGRVLDALTLPQTQADAFLTPLDGPTGRYMSGVEIQGHIIHTLLTGRAGRELSPVSRLGFYLAALFLFSALVTPRSPQAGLAILAAASLALWFGALAVFCRFQVWVHPVLLGIGLALVYTGNLLLHHLRNLHEKRWLRRAFSHYVAPEVVETLMLNPKRLALGGEEVVVTVMFADLAGFSNLAATMAPRDLFHLLNDYFTPMTDLVLEYSGTLDKYVADSLMALWGAPLSQPDHARRACQASLAIQHHVEELVRERRARGLVPLGLHIGLHSGPVVAGNVGSREHFNYTILGDTVNLAARLEGLNHHYGTGIIISDATRTRAGAGFLVRELDQVQVKGRLQPVTIFELLREAPGESSPPWLASFQAGRTAYLQRDWPLATRYFAEVLRLKPEDGPATLYLNRCRHHLAFPPPPDWEGVAVFDGK